MEVSGSFFGNPPAVELARAIVEARRALYEPDTMPKPRATNWASGISSCARQMAYNRTAWDKREPISIELAQRFKAGRVWESSMRQELMEIGFEPIAVQSPIDPRMRSVFQVGGKIDNLIVHKGTKVLLEIKTVHPSLFNRFKSQEDMEKNHWGRRYLRQGMIYLLGCNTDQGIFLFNDCMNHWLPVPFYLDYDYAEAILKTLEKTNEHVATWDNGKQGSLPDRIPYGEECQHCDFAKICLQDVMNTGAELIRSEELEADLKLREQLHPHAKQFKALDDRIKELLRERPKTIIGDYLITTKKTERTVYDIPPEVKSQYASKEESVMMV